MKSQFIIGSLSAESGKTIFMLGLTRLLQRRNIKVQPYKCGPENMDVKFHSCLGERQSINLDSWLAGRSHLQFIYNKYGEGADICLIDGQLGVFDGYRKYQGSCAELASLLRIPIILVVNARLNSTCSLAPILYGFKHFYNKVKIVGVVLDEVTSTAQYSYLKSLCVDAGLECFGYIPYADDFKLPGHHTGATTVLRNEVTGIADKIASVLEKTVDIDSILVCTKREFPCRYTLPYTSDVEPDTYIPIAPRQRIAIAKDPVFQAIYHENLAKLSRIGEISFFSPLYSQNVLPKADIYYFPAGYPELFARQLHRWRKLMEQIKEFAENGGKILAEGGGMVYLSRTLTIREGGTPYKMTGIFPIDFVSAYRVPLTGYRQIKYGEMHLKGYECNYSRIVEDNAASYQVAQSYNLKGQEVKSSLYRYKNVIATPSRLYLGEVEIEKLWM